VSSSHHLRPLTAIAVHSLAVQDCLATGRSTTEPVGSGLVGFRPRGRQFHQPRLRPISGGSLDVHYYLGRTASGTKSRPANVLNNGRHAQQVSTAILLRRSLRAERRSGWLADTNANYVALIACAAPRRRTSRFQRAGLGAAARRAGPLRLALASCNRPSSAHAVRSFCGETQPAPLPFLPTCSNASRGHGGRVAAWVNSDRSGFD